MRKVIEFFLNLPVWGNAAILIILMFGLFSLFNMKRAFFPELDPNRVVVNVFYPGASPQEMEDGVTIKIEQAVKGIEGIEKINSTSSENSAMIRIDGYTDTDMDQLMTEVENAVNSINSFPQGAERPIVTRIKSGGMSSMVAFVGISAINKDLSLTDLTDKATQVERDLLNSKDITQLEKVGFPEKEIAIHVKEQDLTRFGISMQEIATAVGTRNIDITAGIIRGGIEEMSIRSNDRETTAEEIEKIQLRALPTGESITIGDVAEVKLGYAEDSQESRYNGFPAVQFRVNKTLDEDLEDITLAIEAYQKKFNEENEDYEFVIYYAFNNLLNERIDLLSNNGMMGLILVLLFLGMFLNLKLSAWVAFGIPFSFLGMFIFGIPYGMSINMISLFGMILVVGILVDDGIVIAENIYTHYEMGKSPRKAALDGTMEVLTSVFSSVLTTIVAFSILLFVEGMEMMREMAFVVIACLAFSLFEAFIILPAHLGHERILSKKQEKYWPYWLGAILMVAGLFVMYFGTQLIDYKVSYWALLFPFVLIVFGAVLFFAGYSRSPMDEKVRSGADFGIKYVRDNWFRKAVEMIVGSRLKWYRLSFFIPLIFIFVISGFLSSGVISSTIFPDIQPDFISIESAYKPGDNKSKSLAFVNKATQILQEENQRIIDETGDTLVSYFSSNVGFSENIGQMGNHTSEIMAFIDAEGAKTPVDTLSNRIIRRLEATDEARLAEEVFVGGFNRFGKEIEVGLTGSNEASLFKARDYLKKELENLGGIINIKDNMPEGRKEVYLEMLPQAEVYGITKGEVLTQVRQAFFGQEAQRVIIGTDEVKIWVRYPPEERKSIANLEQMKIRTMAGLSIPLKEICSFEIGRAPQSLKRRDGQRVIVVDADCEDPDKVGDINKVITDSILPILTQTYPDVETKQFGQVEQSEKTQTSMTYMVLICFAIMIIILTLHFNSFGSSLLILMSIPAGIFGSILGHGIVGIPVSMLSAFGMIALIGVLINDSIVFLDRYNDLLVEGKSVREAAIEAAISRFRPILLTSLTTVAGLLPIISESSMQAQFLIPMAVSIAFGVLFGTVFIMFFYPAAIVFWNGGRRKIHWLLTGVWLDDRSQVEPVVKRTKRLNEI